MNAEPPGIGVVPVGHVSEVAPKIIAAHISGYLDLRAEVLPAAEHPVYALDPIRFQYDAGRILQKLESRPYGKYAKLIAVADIDLFVPIESLKVLSGVKNSSTASLTPGKCLLP